MSYKTIAVDPGQWQAIRNLDSGKILVGDVGSGKSRTALIWAYTRLMGGRVCVEGVSDWKAPTRPLDILVITTAKKRDSLDWEKEALDLGISTDRDLSLSGITIEVDSWNNLHKYEQREGMVVLFDEQRVVGYGAWTKAFLKVASKNYWILLSATPGEVWLDYLPVFMANGFYRNKSEFARRHVKFNNHVRYPKVDYYLEENVLEELRGRLLVTIPHERHTVRHMRYQQHGYDKAMYDKAWKERWNPYTNEPIKDVAELFQVIRKVVNSDSSRSDTIIDLLDRHPRLVVFYNFNYELEILRSLTSRLGTNVEIAEWNGHRHEPVPTSKSWLYLVQYTAGAEAWECTTTNAMAFYSQTYGFKVFQQAQGRIDRRNTPFVDLYYYVFLSDSPIDRAIGAKQRAKKSFSEAAFARKSGISFDDVV